MRTTDGRPYGTQRGGIEFVGGDVLDAPFAGRETVPYNSFSTLDYPTIMIYNR